MRSRSLYFEIFAVSLAAILLEITYTRIFSFKLGPSPHRAAVKQGILAVANRLF